MHFSFTIFIHKQAISIDSALWRASNHAHRLKRLASCIHTLKHTLAHREGAYPHFYTHREGAYPHFYTHTERAHIRPPFATLSMRLVGLGRGSLALMNIEEQLAPI